MTVSDLVLELPGSQEIEALIKNLRIQKNHLLPPIAFVLTAQKYTKKIEKSYSGQCLSKVNLNNARLAALIVCRIWETNSEKCLPSRAVNAIQPLSDDLEDIRKNLHPDWPSEFLEIGKLNENIENLKLKIQKFKNSTNMANLRVYRTEELAHSIGKASRDRQKLQQFHDLQAPTFRCVIDCARFTIDVIDKLISIWKFHIENSHQSLSVEMQYAECFWRSVPQFSQSEDTSALFEERESIEELWRFETD